MIFKDAFGRNDRKDYTLDLLSTILCREKSTFKNLRVKNSIILDRETIKNRRFELDVLAETDEELFSLEMQNVNNKYSEIKNISYSMKMYVDQFKSGKDLTNGKKMIQIIIINHDEVNRNNTKLINKCSIKSEDNPNYILLKDKFQIIVVDLKCETEYTNISKEMIGYVKLFKANSLKEAEISIKFNPMLKGVIENMEKFCSNEYVQDYSRELMYQNSMISESEKKGRVEGIELGRTEGIELGRTEGIELGRTEGIELGRTEGIELGRTEGSLEKMNEIAGNLILNTNLTVEEISTSTGLKICEVNKIKKQITKLKTLKTS